MRNQEAAEQAVGLHGLKGGQEEMRRRGVAVRIEHKDSQWGEIWVKSANRRQLNAPESSRRVGSAVGDQAGCFHPNPGNSRHPSRSRRGALLRRITTLDRFKMYELL